MNGNYEDTGSLHRDYTGAKIGMWLFLATEVFLFIGPFLLYAAYRYKHPAEFHAAAGELNVVLGAVNTVVLLTSSLTVALAIAAIRRGRKNHSVVMLLATAGLGVFFLINKYMEWSAKISHGIYPGSEKLAAWGHGETAFYGLYYFMTGIHALHVIIGVGILCVAASMVAGGSINRDDPVKVENAGLYWHIVDVIWIFIFQLMYMSG